MPTGRTSSCTSPWARSSPARSPRWLPTTCTGPDAPRGAPDAPLAPGARAPRGRSRQGGTLRGRSPPRPVPGDRPIKLLVADTDPRAAQQAGRQLRLLGHDVLLAGDLEHALEIIEARAPEVVLAGLGPGAVAQLTQALDAIAVGAAVIAVADEVSTPTVLDAMRAGAVDLIGRPIDPDELQAALQRAENLLRSRDRAQRGAMEELREGIAREHMVAFMIGLANVIDAKSPYTREHSDRVAQRTKVFARYLN